MARLVEVDCIVISCGSAEGAEVNRGPAGPAGPWEETVKGAGQYHVESKSKSHLNYLSVF